MPDLLRKLRGRKPTPRLTDEDIDLEQFFTDAEHACQVFEQLVSAARPPKRLLVIHGVGGVGKSTLLKMYRLFCRRRHIPVALVGGEEAPSPVNVLADWASDLSGEGVKLPTFQDTLTHYRALQAKVETEAKKASQVAEKLGKAAAKTAVEMAASAIPVAGPLVAAVGGAGAEAFVDWLRGFLSKPDLELYLDPTKRLTDDFLSDLTRAVSRQRTVLMADTYEQMTTLDDWVRDLTRQLPEDVLLVIAGRAMPEWDRAWPGWMGRAEIVKLEEMTSDDLRTLVQRYYAHIRGGEPDPEQVEAVVQFARGLPMAATTVVQLWVRHGVEDFREVKPQVVADLVDRLLEGVPPEMQPAFEVAAVLRYFNADALQALLDSGDADRLYAELRRWPFIHPRREGLAVHDTMREITNEALHVRTPERFRALHERAAGYYEARLKETMNSGRDTTDRSTRSYLIESLYHWIFVDEAIGLRLIRTTFGSFLRRYDLTLCDELLAVMKSLPEVGIAVKQWTEYFALQIVQQRSSWEYEFDRLERFLSQNLPIELEIEARWNLGITLDYRGERERAIQELSHALRLSKTIPTPDLSIQAKILTRLGALQSGSANFEVAHQSLTEALDIAHKVGNPRLIADTLSEINYLFQKYDRFEDARPVLQELVHLAEEISDEREQGLAHARLGEYLVNMNDFSEEAREQLEKAAHLLRKVGDTQSLAWANRSLGLLLIGRNELQAALPLLEKSVDGYRERKATRGLFRSLVALCECFIALSEYDKVRDLWPEIEELGKRVTLGDWTARWRVVQGHVVWGLEAFSTDSSLGGFDVALHHYQQALIYALRYNRFLLDEVLWGGGVATPLRPLIPHCLERDQPPAGSEPAGGSGEGRRMLIALRDWWQNGVNDVGTPRPDTISPIPEGIPLLEAERIARERELGDGSPQRTVMEQIGVAWG